MKTATTDQGTVAVRVMAAVNTVPGIAVFLGPDNHVLA